MRRDCGKVDLPHILSLIEELFVLKAGQHRGFK